MVSRFERLGDDTYTEHDSAQGWIGTSRFQHGLATGRPSPVAPRRVRPVTGLMRARSSFETDANGVATGYDRPDLVTETDVAGHGHGQLFDPAPFVRNKAEVLGEAGVPERRLSSGEGFMPRLGNVAGTTDPTERAKILADKTAVIQHAAKITRRVDVADPSRPAEFYSNATHGPLGTSTPSKTQLENMSKFYHEGTEGDWYQTESDQVGEAAYLHGTTPQKMRKATAHLSAQKTWNTGHPQDGNVTYPNLDAAKAVVDQMTRTRTKAANEGRGWDPRTSAESTTVPKVGSTTERVKPQSEENMRKAGEVFAGIQHPAARIITSSERENKSDMAGEKVPNFDLALARNSDSRAARREATQAYTADTWEVRAGGIADYSHVGSGGLTKDKGLVEERTRGQYDFMAMNARRSAAREGMTTSEGQQHRWRVVRGTNGMAAPKQQFNFETTGGRGLRSKKNR